MTTKIHESHSMRWVGMEVLYVCEQCYHCDCHHFDLLTKPCIGRSDHVVIPQEDGVQPHQD